MKQNDKLLYSFVLITSGIGLFDAIYLWLIKITENESLCPQGLGDCWSVNNSIYSEIYGVPVSIFGMLAYLSMLLLIYFESRNKSFKQTAVLAQFGISLIGFLFSLYLIYIQFGVLHQVCPFCILSAITMTTVFTLSTIRMKKLQASIIY